MFVKNAWSNRKKFSLYLSPREQNSAINAWSENSTSYASLMCETFGVCFKFIISIVFEMHAVPTQKAGYYKKKSKISSVWIKLMIGRFIQS